MAKIERSAKVWNKWTSAMSWRSNRPSPGGIVSETLVHQKQRHVLPYGQVHSKQVTGSVWSARSVTDTPSFGGHWKSWQALSDPSDHCAVWWSRRTR